MRFNRYLTEFSREHYGAGITFIDIDETMFHTFAKILVIKDGKVIKELDNQEFNTYELKDGESYDFHQFRDAKLFSKTSVPIPQTINRVKKMLSQIKSMDSDSRIIFLTARTDFDDKKTFLDTFRKYGIDMNKPYIYVERTGNMKSGTISERKKKVVLEYLRTGKYRRVRLIDDDMKNLKDFKSIENNLPKEIEQKIIDEYDLDMSKEKLPPISFYALLIQPDGSLRLI